VLMEYRCTITEESYNKYFHQECWCCGQRIQLDPEDSIAVCLSKKGDSDRHIYYSELRLILEAFEVLLPIPPYKFKE
jgi:hypothetical protein